MYRFLFLAEVPYPLFLQHLLCLPLDGVSWGAYRGVSWDASLAVATAARWYKESGAQSFEGMTLETINVAPSNDNGTFELLNVSEKGFQLIATGVEDGDGDGELMQFRLTYNAFSDSTIWERVEE